MANNNNTFLLYTPEPSDDAYRRARRVSLDPEYPIRDGLRGYSTDDIAAYVANQHKIEWNSLYPIWHGSVPLRNPLQWRDRWPGSNVIFTAIDFGSIAFARTEVQNVGEDVAQSEIEVIPRHRAVQALDLYSALSPIASPEFQNVALSVESRHLWRAKSAIAVILTRMPSSLSTGWAACIRQRHIGIARAMLRWTAARDAENQKPKAA